MWERRILFAYWPEGSGACTDYMYSKVEILFNIQFFYVILRQKLPVIVHPQIWSMPLGLSLFRITSKSQQLNIFIGFVMTPITGKSGQLFITKNIQKRQSLSIFTWSICQKTSPLYESNYTASMCFLITKKSHDASVREKMTVLCPPGVQSGNSEVSLATSLHRDIQLYVRLPTEHIISLRVMILRVALWA